MERCWWAAVTLFLPALLAAASSETQTVHIVFSAHLDVGYTGEAHGTATFTVGKGA